MAQGTGQRRGTVESCHRCGNDLPASPGESGALFCPHCGAPQLVLPEYLRATHPEAAGPRTTGALPPPRPRMVEWRAALPCTFAVALVGALLSVAGLLNDTADAAAGFWRLSCGVVAVTLYARVGAAGGSSGFASGLRSGLRSGVSSGLRSGVPSGLGSRSGARMDGRVGARVGLATGVLTVALSLAALAVGGGAARFALHRTGRLDGWVRDTMRLPEALHPPAPAPDGRGGSGDPETDAELAAFWSHLSGVSNSAEGQAGWTLVRLGTGWVFLLGFATAGGALAGALRTRRSRVTGVL